MRLQLTQEEWKALKQIYAFQKPRRFRYGLNINYIKVRREVINELMQKKLVWPLRKYGHTYIFLTRKGRQIVENA